MTSCEEFVLSQSSGNRNIQRVWKKDSKIAGTAATNLSFVLFLVCSKFHWDKWTTLSPDKD